ncbi:MAG: hypothetical protein KFB95_08965 [Simkaniaceae bacterium]|nr:MAG: hypothetical protein KFB95_08965 [Simkaniaceae bacterium]
MSDAIEAVSGVSETQSSAQANLMQQLEMQDIQNTNLTSQVNQTYNSSLQSLAQSTGDPAIAGQNDG